MSILDIPKHDRPGERLRAYGAGALTDSELLEILLGKSAYGSVVDISNKLLSKYNLDKLNELSFNELRKECNNDTIIALRILSFLELSKRRTKLLRGGYKKEVTCAKDVYSMFVDKLRDKKKEILYSVLLDTKNKVLKIKRVSEGTLNSSLIHPREIFRDAIKEGSNSLILVHNHPSGDCSPSDEDIIITEKLIKLGDELGIKVLDHVIIGKEKYYSYVVDN